jgi:ankyrin repeat protein
VDARSDSGGVPLHYAAYGGHKEVVELLISKGANVNSRNLDSWNYPNESLYRTDMAETIEDRCRNGDSGRGSWHYEFVQLLLKGRNLNSWGINGWTPLHYAAYGGHKEVAELLISKGGDVEAMDVLCGTPLDYASFWQHGDMVNLLRRHSGR